MHAPHKGRLVFCGHYHDIIDGQSYMNTEGLKCIYSDGEWERIALRIN